MTLNAESLKRIFPRCSASFIEANAAGVSDAKPERIPKKALDGGVSGEAKSPQRAHLRIRRCALRSLDRDNLYGGAKPLIDCIVASGLIEDDSPEHVELVIEQERIAKRADERTEIEISYGC